MNEIASPCVNLCRLDTEGRYCEGCGRSLDEIAAWGDAGADEKRAILRRIAARQAIAKSRPSL